MSTSTTAGTPRTARGSLKENCASPCGVRLGAVHVCGVGRIWGRGGFAAAIPRQCLPVHVCGVLVGRRAAVAGGGCGGGAGWVNCYDPATVLTCAWRAHGASELISAARLLAHGWRGTVVDTNTGAHWRAAVPQVHGRQLHQVRLRLASFCFGCAPTHGHCCALSSFAFLSSARRRGTH